MKKKLFGGNISCSCEYCTHNTARDGDVACEKNKTIKRGKCRSFSYDPFRRVPHGTPELPQYSPEDFAL